MEYLPLRHVVPVMLSIFERLFGMQFTELSTLELAELSPNGRSENFVWHPGVRVLPHRIWTLSLMADSFRVIST